MNLINSSPIVHKLLHLIAPVTAMMPKSIMKLRMYKKSGVRPDLNNPKDLEQLIISRYFEMLENPEERRMLADLADKIAVRRWVEERIGHSVLTKLLGTYDRAEDIDWDKLPVPCAVKTNNGCGTNIFIRSRSDIDAARYTALLNRWLSYPYGDLSGQPHYSGIKPQILVEEFLEQTPGSTELPLDYKVFCFGGKARFILFYEGRKANSHIAKNIAYDTDWNVLENAVNYPSDEPAPRPAALDSVLSMAESLSKGLDFVRVDFYIINGNPVFGEMTFTPDIYTNFTPEFLRKAMTWYPAPKS